MKAGAPVRFRKIHNAGLGHTGTVDLLGCVAGVFVSLELKRPGRGAPEGLEAQPRGWEQSEATDAQKRDLMGWREAGGVAAVVDNRRYFRRLVERILHRRGWRQDTEGYWLHASEPVEVGSL